MVRLLSDAQERILKSSEEGKQLLEAFQGASRAVTALGQTTAHRKGGKRDEMKELVAVRTEQLAAIHTFLQSARTESLEGADARLAQIATLAVGAQHDVRRAMDTERMDFALTHSLKNLYLYI